MKRSRGWISQGCYGKSWRDLEERSQHEDQPWKVRFGSQAGAATGVRSLCQRVSGLAGLPSPCLVDPSHWMTDEEILSYLLTRNATHRGGDIRIEKGIAMPLGSMCRQSIDPTHWRWKVLLSYQWKQAGQHINVSETVTVLDVLRKLAKDERFHATQPIILIDNMVALSVLCKGRSSLQQLVVAPATESRYYVAVSRFLRFLRERAYSYPTTHMLLDARVCEFVESLWQSGDPKSYASDCLSGLGHYIPQCQRFLVGAWRLHGSWTRAELPARALPFTPLIVYALAQQAFELKWPDVAILLLLGFDRYARTGELFAARREDFVFDHSLRRVVWPLTPFKRRYAPGHTGILGH